MSSARLATTAFPAISTALLAASLLTLVACYSNPNSEDPADGADAPLGRPPAVDDSLVDEPDVEGQSEGWNAASLECTDSTDCMDHETCIDSVCQIDRCTAAAYESLPPLGDSFLFYADLEVGIIDRQTWGGADYWVDAYSPGNAVLDYDVSWMVGDQPAFDIAGGDLLGNDEELYAIILEDVPELFLLTDNGPVSYSLPFSPTAIAAGDVDSDSVDEVIAVGGSRYAICDLQIDYCQPFDMPEGIEMVDVAVADVDGDILREAVFLFNDENNQRTLHVENFDAEESGTEESWELAVDTDIHRIAAGDIDGDGRAEIVTLEEGGWMNVTDDLLDVYRLIDLADGSQLERISDQSSGFSHIVDIAIGDTNADEVAELLVLDENNTLSSARFIEGELEFDWTLEFAVTGEPFRIAMADLDDNSPRAVLSVGPEVIPGASVPVVAMTLPPYSYEYSAGFSSTGYGMSETMSENYSDTVSLSLGVDVGVGGDFLGLFAAKYSEKIGVSTSMTLGETQNTSTGNRSSMRSQPDDFGFHYGAVVVSWGCFHAYTYEVNDPSDLVPGSDGELIVMTVPVDSGTAMISTSRYNALATVVGDLPLIDAPYTIGDLYDYPTEPENIYGEPIEDDEYVFPGLDWYEVSDVGYVGWFNVVGESVTNSSTFGMDMGVSAGVTVSGISVGLSTSAGWGKGYSLTLGETATFYGAIPPFRDDPKTEADEYSDNFYRVAPIVYMQDYTDSQGNISAFYVQTYAVNTGN